MAFVPFLFLGIILMSKLRWTSKPKKGEHNVKQDFYTDSNALLSDIILNYKTVISFGSKNIEYLIGKYEHLL